MDYHPRKSRQTHKDSRPLAKIGILGSSLVQMSENTTPCEGGQKRHPRKGLGLMSGASPTKLRGLSMELKERCSCTCAGQKVEIQD